MTLELHKMKALVYYSQFQSESCSKKDEIVKIIQSESLNHLYSDPRDVDMWLLHAKSLLFQLNQQLSDCNVSLFHKSKKNILGFIKVKCPCP